MNNTRISIYENPTRVAELDPAGSLERAGFAHPMTLCDIGAGSGVFTFPAAAMTGGSIYALDISDAMIELLKTKAMENNNSNVIVKKVCSDELPLGDNCCDMTIIVSAFHEVDHKGMMLREIKRILKEKGRLLIIDFHKARTPLGPPADHRIAMDDVLSLCRENGFALIDSSSLGPNFYSLLFEA